MPSLRRGESGCGEDAFAYGRISALFAAYTRRKKVELSVRVDIERPLDLYVQVKKHDPGVTFQLQPWGDSLVKYARTHYCINKWPARVIIHHRDNPTDLNQSIMRRGPVGQSYISVC